MSGKRGTLTSSSDAPMAGRVSFVAVQNIFGQDKSECSVFSVNSLDDFDCEGVAMLPYC